MRIVVILLALIVAGCAHEEAARPKTKPVAVGTDVRTAIVAASIYGYEINKKNKGTCPCPYSQAGACKGKSAWDRPGGAGPRCYKSDVTAADIKRWRELMARPAPQGP